MRCVLHATGLGPEYWSYALIHFVYVKNRVPHSSINTTPYQAMTGNKPNRLNLRIFGSRVVAQMPNTPTGKLDMNNIAQCICVGFTGTDKNVYYINDHRKRIKIRSWVLFDEAHMSVPAQYAPIAVQALQRVGYHVNEEYVKDSIPITSINVQLHHSTARSPTPSASNCSYTVHLDIDSIVLCPHETKLIQTGISMETPRDHQLMLHQKLQDYLPHLTIYQGLISLTIDKEIFIVAHNSDNKELILTMDDDIAMVSIEKHDNVPLNTKPFKPPTPVSQQSSTLQMKTNLKSSSSQSMPSPLLNFDNILSPHHIPNVNARAAKLEAMMQVSLDLPYDLELSTDPYDNHTHHIIAITSRSPTLGMKIDMCKIKNLLILKTCLPGLPAA